jgi:hypothetical protein
MQQEMLPAGAGAEVVSAVMDGGLPTHPFSKTAPAEAPAVNKNLRRDERKV